MTLEARTRPYREEISANLQQMLELGQWLLENPDARADLRAEKFAAWKKLERENVILERMWDESRENWIGSRMNRPVSAGEVARDVVQKLAEEVQ